MQDITSIELNDLLPASQVMVVTLAASTTEGEKLTDAELATVLRGCDEVEALQRSHARLLTFLESQMTVVAPNVSALVGPRVAALMVGQAGGVTELSKIPACNLLVLGKQQRALGGFSSATVQQHVGILHQCPLVANAPGELRKKVLRAVSGK